MHRELQMGQMCSLINHAIEDTLHCFDHDTITDEQLENYITDAVEDALWSGGWEAAVFLNLLHLRVSLKWCDNWEGYKYVELVRDRDDAHRASWYESFRQSRIADRIQP